jgi:uridine kinase
MGEPMFLIGIAGGSGSGKTTFAKKVVNNIPSSDIVILHMDSYYLPSQPKTNYTESGKPNFDHPDAFDWELLKFHLETLKAGEPIHAPVYNFKKSLREVEQTEKIGPCKVVLFEGIFALFSKEIRQLLDVKCFLHVDADIRFTRRLHRDVHERNRSLDSVISQYYDTVRPMYQKFLDPQRQFADFIIGEETDSAARILTSHVREVIANGKPAEFISVNTDQNWTLGVNTITQ